MTARRSAHIGPGGRDTITLHLAVESGAIDIARMLLDAGADPNVRDDKYHATALGWADFFGRADFSELIRQRGGQR